MQASRIAVACATLALASCALPFKQQAAAPGPVASADAYYALGRSYHADAKMQEAQRAYLLALQREPAHADARNGLAVLLAERGDAQQAIAIWRKLAEEERVPHEQALILGNLGHALSKHGDREEALYLLQKAAVLDPVNADNWQRLGDALKAAGDEARAATMLKQADSLRQHDIHADLALAATLAVPLPSVQEAPAGPSAPLRLEISNGNGVRGMASDWARKLRGSEWRTVRVTNTRPFVVPQTRIEFAPGCEAAAQILAKRIGVSALEKDDKVADLRVVLGHDQRPEKTNARARRALAP